MEITTKKFFEIAGIDTSTGKAKILIESSESQFFVTKVDFGRSKRSYPVATVPTLKEAQVLIINQLLTGGESWTDYFNSQAEYQQEIHQAMIQYNLTQIDTNIWTINEEDQWFIISTNGYIKFNKANKLISTYLHEPKIII